MSAPSPYVDLSRKVVQDNWPMLASLEAHFQLYQKVLETLHLTDGNVPKVVALINDLLYTEGSL